MLDYEINSIQGTTRHDTHEAIITRLTRLRNWRPAPCSSFKLQDIDIAPDPVLLGLSITAAILGGSVHCAELSQCQRTAYIIAGEHVRAAWNAITV